MPSRTKFGGDFMDAERVAPAYARSDRGCRVDITESDVNFRSPFSRMPRAAVDILHTGGSGRQRGGHSRADCRARALPAWNPQVQHERTPVCGAAIAEKERRHP